MFIMKALQLRFCSVVILVTLCVTFAATTLGVRGGTPSLPSETFPHAAWKVGQPQVATEISNPMAALGGLDAGISSLRAKEGSKLVIVPISFSLPEDARLTGEAFLSNHDFIAVYSGGESRAAARSLAVGDDGTPIHWLIPKDRDHVVGYSYNVAKIKGASFCLAFIVPKEIDQLEVRFLQPVGVAALKK